LFARDVNGNGVTSVVDIEIVIDEALGPRPGGQRSESRRQSERGRCPEGDQRGTANS